MKKSILLFLFFLSLPLSAANISAQIAGFNTNTGTVRLTLFEEKQKNNFPNKSEKASYTSNTTIINGAAIISFKNVPAGNYAIFVYHDSNNNQKLDHNWIGLPKEKFGYYKHYKVKLRPPSFKDVSFKISDSDMNINIVLQKYLGK